MPRMNAARKHPVDFTLNGRTVRAEAENRMLLSDLLRHEIGLTGTHVGCEHGVCGACTVQIDGKPARACRTSSPAARSSRCARSTSEYCPSASLKQSSKVRG